MELQSYLETLKNEIDLALISELEQINSSPLVVDSMLYSVKNGGKRLRPVLLLMLLDAFGVARQKGMKTAIALEMIHTYSLIHDDLPAMDDDDLRRGHPTNHKVYGEATAILAGDGLLTQAFVTLINDNEMTSETRIALVNHLATEAGAYDGMIAGQMLDIEAENKTVDLLTLKKIHSLKTGALIKFACVAAGLIANQNDQIISQLVEYADALGLAFQIQDDILDVEGDTEKIGKHVGSDAANNKSTYVTLLGLDGAKTMLADEIKRALVVLVSLSANTSMLAELTNYVANRDN